MTLLLILIALIVIYLLPALVAGFRKHMNKDAICAANVLFGWTILGWGLCLVWALTDNVEP